MAIETTDRLKRSDALEALCVLMDRRTAKAIVFEVERSIISDDMQACLITNDGMVALLYAAAAALPFIVAHIVSDESEESQVAA